ncbi:hypothetical protein HSACCH_01825 [Halanaerobium saccharolyticum subsp. saccharolyticum DSM 6643]|uniref:SLH domain-containing protein n=1 Tax=Halanaerobium saccharolyticum subsp. saccharolyticum DSM 6643 TaxID=1293054 RepID=M5EFR9_9FIRM|nr:S-layer homology domain-containing protein [Halanaerobium saccharolyticum]CCU80069.1 hypothetical protein HSACCH_01825 [Halanaerobium saccharolyticum subsp. saccharolyticum DSM 6643]
MKKLTITIALMLVVALAMPAFGASFSDVPSDHWAYNAINKLVAAGIVEGYPDGEYKGQQSMTRYEMAVMVSRALDNIVDEMEAMGEGLTTGQAEDVTAIVKSLMEKNTNDELSDAQAEEVADIVDALTFELRSELKVLGAEVDTLGKDVDELAAKVEAMEVPEDNIEFGMDVTTTFEAASYGEDAAEEGYTINLLEDGDAIDESFTSDPDEFTSKKAFFQEYDFNINGMLGDATFNLDVDTIANVFTEEDHVANAVSETNQNDFMMDSALLEVSYNNYSFQIGDLNDYSVAPYFNDEEDREGIEMTTSYMDNDIKTFVLGADVSEDTFGTTTVDSDANDEEYYGVEVARDMEFGRVTGKLYHARDIDFDGFNMAEYAVTAEKNETTILAAQIEDVVITDAISMGAEVAFSDWERDAYTTYDSDASATEAVAADDDSDIYFNVNGEFVATEELTLDATIETVGEDFVGPYNDLEEASDYDMFNVGAEYVLNENNTVTGAYTLVDHNEPEDKSTVELGLENVYGDFTNNASVEFVMNDDYTDDYETMIIVLGTEYAWDETLTLGAELTNKTKDEAGTDAITYNYLTAFADKELADNITWNTEAFFIDGELDEINEGQGNGMTTSLSVSF